MERNEVIEKHTSIYRKMFGGINLILSDEMIAADAEN